MISINVSPAPEGATGSTVPVGSPTVLIFAMLATGAVAAGGATEIVFELMARGAVEQHAGVQAAPRRRNGSSGSRQHRTCISRAAQEHATRLGICRCAALRLTECTGD